jgi:hypothetical protein
MKFFKITFLFSILSRFLKIKTSLIYPTFIGFRNYIKILRNKDTLLVPVNALLSHYLYYSINGYQRVTSEILFHCIFQKWSQSDVDIQKLERTFSKFEVP